MVQDSSPASLVTPWRNDLSFEGFDIEQKFGHGLRQVAHREGKTDKDAVSLIYLTSMLTTIQEELANIKSCKQV